MLMCACVYIVHMDVCMCECVGVSIISILFFMSAFCIQAFACSLVHSVCACEFASTSPL